jgi:AbrB family looped-hinge helix DNA binding protein
VSTATLSSKYQISVPKDVRDALGLVPGQKLEFINTGSAIKLVPQPRVAELVGIGRGASTADLRDRVDRRVGGSTTRRARAARRPRKAP